MPHPPSAPRAWPAVVGATAIALLVVTAGLLIVASPSWSAGEVRVVAAVQGASNLVFDIVALTINAAFGPVGAALIVAITVTWVVLISRSWRLALRMLLLLLVPWACAEVVKLVVQRPRPDPALLAPMIVAEPGSFSYPSGHTAFAAALACALILTLAGGRRRGLAVAAGIAVVLVTAWSRVYLGVHFPTDVLASAAIVPCAAVAVDRLTAGRTRFR